MEQNQLQSSSLIIPEHEITLNSSKPFIEANTKEVSLSHLKQDCTIPVFSKDNECTIAHQEFINTAQECVYDIFNGQDIAMPEIRVSHIVKGRVPSAIGKPVKELIEDEKTIYYERMAFSMEIPSISETINGNRVNLTLGGVRAYNHENLYSKKTFEKFKFFIGFKNMVCCNMCVSSDGFVGDIKVASLDELRKQILDAVGSYQIQQHLKQIEQFSQNRLTEKQFAQLIGRCRLYNFLPKADRLAITPLLLNDSQISAVAKGYYEDEAFARDSHGDISLWKFYNLLTGANKSSYIDKFIHRSVNAHVLTQELSKSLQNKTSLWYIN